MAAKVKVDQIETVDGTGSITLNNDIAMASSKTLPAASLTGTLPAISGANLTGVLPLAGGTMTGVLTVNSGSNLAFQANGTTYTQIWQTLQSPNDLTLKTTANKFISFQPNSVEKVRIHSSGVTSFNDGIELGSGLDATAANTLDDYEDGTWTPTLNNTGGTPSYTWQNGHYAKIGNFVWLTANVKFTVTPSGATQQAVGGLPFASKNTGGHYFGAEIHPYQGFNYNNDGMMAQIFDGSSIAYLYNYNASTTYNRGSVLANMIGTTIEFKFTAFYTTT